MNNSLANCSHKINSNYSNTLLESREFVFIGQDWTTGLDYWTGFSNNVGCSARSFSSVSSDSEVDHFCLQDRGVTTGAVATSNAGNGHS